MQRCSRGGAVVVQMRWNKKGTTEVVQSWDCRSRGAEVLSHQSEVRDWCKGGAGAVVVQVCRGGTEVVVQRCRGAEWVQRFMVL